MAGTFKGEIGMVSKWYGGGKYIVIFVTNIIAISWYKYTFLCMTIF